MAASGPAVRHKSLKKEAHCILSLALVKDWRLESAEDSLLKLLVSSSCHWHDNGSAPAENDSTGTLLTCFERLHS